MYEARRLPLVCSILGLVGTECAFALFCGVQLAQQQREQLDALERDIHARDDMDRRRVSPLPFLHSLTWATALDTEQVPESVPAASGCSCGSCVVSGWLGADSWGWCILRPSCEYTRGKLIAPSAVVVCGTHLRWRWRVLGTL